MSNRVNKFRVWFRVFGDKGVYIKMDNRMFFTPAATAQFIAKSTRKMRDYIDRPGHYFWKVQLGNEKGWIDFDDIKHDHEDSTIVDKLAHAREIHQSFYEDGEGDKFL